MTPDYAQLKEALWNLSPSCMHDPATGRGILVGLVAGLMSMGISFDTALWHCDRCLPPEVYRVSIPDGWEANLTVTLV
jgi:hypothetical protein